MDKGPHPDVEKIAAPHEPVFHALRQCPTQQAVVLQFKALQLKRIGELQEELLALQTQAALGDYRDAQQLNDRIDAKLQRYADALRNYETLSQHSSAMFPPGGHLLIPKLSKTAEPIGKLDKWLLPLTVFLTGSNESFVKWRNTLRKRTPARWWQEGCLFELADGVEADKVPSCSILWLETRVQELGLRYLDSASVPSSRLAMAFFGGIALIGPMLIMVLQPSRNTCLITTSVATFLFATLLALGARDSTGKDVLAATAAYAAVLVVFVGTAMTTSTPS